MCVLLLTQRLDWPTFNYSMKVIHMNFIRAYLLHSWWKVISLMVH